MSNENKPSLSLLPKSGLWEAAAALTYGRDKHGRYAWKQGSHNLTELLDKVLRHVTQFADGEDYCSESNLLHLGSAAADLLIAIDVYHNQKHLDDRHETNKTLTGVPDKTVVAGSESEKESYWTNAERAISAHHAQGIAAQAQEKEAFWVGLAKETIDIAKQMAEPRTVVIPDYDLDSDNNTEETLPMTLLKGMKIIHNDGQVIEAQTNGTFFIKKGSKITW